MPEEDRYVVDPEEILRVLREARRRAGERAKARAREQGQHV